MRTDKLLEDEPIVDLDVRTEFGRGRVSQRGRFAPIAARSTEGLVAASAMQGEARLAGLHFNGISPVHRGRSGRRTLARRLPRQLGVRQPLTADSVPCRGRRVAINRSGLVEDHTVDTAGSLFSDSAIEHV